MPLITAEQLRLLPGPVVLDVRWSLAHGADDSAYAAGHIPGAVFIDLSGQLCGPAGPQGRHPLPDPGDLQHVLRSAGVRSDKPVVVYDGGDLLAAARAWWTLRWAGLQDVRVLDGGYPAWQAIGAPQSTEAVNPEPSDVTVTPGRMPVLDSAEAAKYARIATLLDVRAAERYRGETEPIDPVAGHIPGAKNLPGSDIMGPNGFRDLDELRELFARFGDDVGVYCGSGITAARTALAMTAAAASTPAVYIGSWSQWVADDSRPVATGTE